MRKSLVTAFIATASVSVCYGSSRAPVDSVLKESFVAFPNIAPGIKYKIQKVYDPISKTIKFKSMDFATADDWVKMADDDAQVETVKYGAIVGNLKKKFDDAKDEDKLKIIVSLKLPKGIKHPSKFEATPDELDRHSKSLLTIQPVVSLNSFFSDHGLGLPIVIDNKTGIYELKKYQLRELMFDKNLVSIEEYVEHTPVIKAFSILPALIGQAGNPEFSSLARSAYNHSNTITIPSTAGQGVKAATFESGITPSFLTCTGLSGAHIELGGSEHSDACWRIMTYTAPGATFYHRASTTYFGQTNYIISNGIQTSSLSYGNGTEPTNSTFREMDDFAFKSPYTVFCTPTGNDGTDLVANWGCYNAISVGNVRHRNFTTFDIRDRPCGLNGVNDGGCTQTKNPSGINNPGMCITRPTSPDCAGDREMPYIVAPGFTPQANSTTDCKDITPMREPCQPNTGHWCGTSYSAPVANGIAADVIAADGRMFAWPEKVRAAILLTAENVTGGDWNSNEDGEDGNGVIYGANAVTFAKTHFVTGVGFAAVAKGLAVGQVTTSNWSTALTFNVLIPSTIPAGKNLRILLTWDSNPSQVNVVNALSDLDLNVTTSTGSFFASTSFDGNVEVVNIPGSSLAAGSTTVATISKYTNRIPTSGTANYFYYAIAWDWVATHAP